jgi:hypothetical protein
VPVIVITSDKKESKSLVNQLSENNDYTLLEKPLNVDALLEVMRKLLVA